jgi:hypothetical protein
MPVNISLPLSMSYQDMFHTQVYYYLCSKVNSDN